VEHGAEANHPVFELLASHVAAVVQTITLLREVDHAPEAAAESFELGPGAGASHLDQGGLVRGSGNSGQGADLGIGQHPPAKAVIHLGQLTQRAGHPHLLAGGARIEADTPGEPVRAAQRSLPLPFPRGIEGPNAREQAVSGGIEVRRRPRYLIAQRDRIERNFVCGNEPNHAPDYTGVQ
jgi:hypothetical protein